MSNLQTQQELQLYYWGPHFDMVKEYNAKHGTDIKPWECVKLIGHSGEWSNTYGCNPLFDCKSGIFHFALTILYDDKRKEHRAVFVGDKVFDKNLSYELEIIDYDKAKPLVFGCITFEGLDWDKISWNPPTPKRTFKLNDVELPCPVKQDRPISLRVSMNNNDFGYNFNFNNFDEGYRTFNSLLVLLTAARDK